MLRTKPPQTSFYGSYLYDRIIPQDHLLRKINQVVDFSFVNELVKDRYTLNFGRSAEETHLLL
jgi:hypothetical protein